MKKLIIITILIIVNTLVLNAEEKNAGMINEWGKGADNTHTNKIYTDVSGGKDFSLALTTNGTIVAWGDNYEGQTDVPAGTNFVAISAGNRHAVAIKTDGSLVAWGQNLSGATNCPVGNDYAQISSSIDFALALKEDGSIIGWGINDDGQTEVPEGYNYKKVVAGSVFGLALTIDGSLVIWGAEFDTDLYDSLTNMPAGNDFIDIAAGEDHCVAVRFDGSPVVWGQLNDQTNGIKVAAVDAGWQFSSAIQLDGTLIAWGGMNVRGELNCPQGNTFLKVASGYQHSLAVNYSGLSAQIFADRTRGLYTLPVRFLAGTSGTNANNIYYRWDFQDDGIVDFEGWGENIATNLYTNGLYSVRLTVSNHENDVAYNFRDGFIDVLDEGVIAGFSANILTGIVPFSVNFTDSSQNYPLNWNWDFDNDGSIDSFLKNPTYTYNTTGTYSVVMMVSNNFGEGSGASSDRMTKVNYITVIPEVIADFSVDKTQVNINETVNFTNLSENDPLFWNWDFENDGIIDSTLENPSYSYSDFGFKTVKLICGNSFSVSTNTKINLIAVPITNSTLFVWQEGTNIAPFDSWESAATNIQDAINLSMSGAEIFISNGVYSSGGYIKNGTNVFVADSARKFTGCGEVTVDARNLMRGAYVVSSELYRIKFINGKTDDDGGAVYAVNSDLITCMLVDSAAKNGGGIVLTNTTLKMHYIINCTIANNTATSKGGGLYSENQNEIINSILYSNFAATGSNYFFPAAVSVIYSCTEPAPTTGNNNIYDNPEFEANYIISDTSPCINMGYTFPWLVGQEDIYGNPRVQNDNVDIGAYETSVPEPFLFIIYYLSFIIYYLKRRN